MITYDSEGRKTYIDGVDGYNALSDEKQNSIDRVPPRRREVTLNTQIEDLRRGK